MDGNFRECWMEHPSLGLIKVFQDDLDWVYQCYTRNGQKPVSKEKPLDSWTWALAEEVDRNYDEP